MNNNNNKEDKIIINDKGPKTVNKELNKKRIIIKKQNSYLDLKKKQDEQAKQNILIKQGPLEEINENIIQPNFQQPFLINENKIIYDNLNYMLTYKENLKEIENEESLKNLKKFEQSEAKDMIQTLKKLDFLKKIGSKEPEKPFYTPKDLLNKIKKGIDDQLLLQYFAKKIHDYYNLKYFPYKRINLEEIIYINNEIFNILNMNIFEFSKLYKINIRDLITTGDLMGTNLIWIKLDIITLIMDMLLGRSNYSYAVKHKKQKIGTVPLQKVIKGNNSKEIIDNYSLFTTVRLWLYDGTDITTEGSSTTLYSLPITDININNAMRQNEKTLLRHAFSNLFPLFKTYNGSYAQKIQYEYLYRENNAINYNINSSDNIIIEENKDNVLVNIKDLLEKPKIENLSLIVPEELNQINPILIKETNPKDLKEIKINKITKIPTSDVKSISKIKNVKMISDINITNNSNTIDINDLLIPEESDDLIEEKINQEENKMNEEELEKKKDEIDKLIDDLF